MKYTNGLTVYQKVRSVDNLARYFAHALKALSMAAYVVLMLVNGAQAESVESSRTPKRIGIHLLTGTDRLCQSAEVFIASISSALLVDCRLQRLNDSSCEPKDVLMMQLKVKQVLGLNERQLKLVRCNKMTKSL